MLVDRKALEIDIPSRTELRLDRAGYVDWRLHIELLDAALHDAEFERDDACHLRASQQVCFRLNVDRRYLNRATERNFTITLAEVQVSNTKLRSFDMHRQKHLRSSR